MHFGQFNLMGYRERGVPSHRVFDEAVEQVKLSDEAGLEIAWFAEHHFSNYCVCPSPLMMVARCAAETTRIKLGTAVVVIPLYHPVRLLEEIGMADSMCRGRLVLGIGSGYQPYEFERFGADLANSKAQLEEFMDLLELAFTRETFSFEGEHYHLQETHISSRPMNGVPEVWIAGDNPVIHEIAARRGYIPTFGGRLLGADYLVEMRETVARSYRAAGLDTETMPLGIHRYMCVTESRAQSLAYVDNARHVMRLAYALRHREEVVDGSMLVERPIKNEPPIEAIADSLLVGDCETIAERLTDEIRRARPSHMMFQFQVGGSPKAKALETIERFATDIRPMVEKELGPLDALNEPSVK